MTKAGLMEKLKAHWKDHVAAVMAKERKISGNDTDRITIVWW